MLKPYSSFLSETTFDFDLIQLSRVVFNEKIQSYKFTKNKINKIATLLFDRGYIGQ